MTMAGLTSWYLFSLKALLYQSVGESEDRVASFWSLFPNQFHVICHYDHKHVLCWMLPFITQNNSSFLLKIDNTCCDKNQPGEKKKTNT